MSFVWLAVLVGLGIWLEYGNGALGTVATLAAMVAAGAGVENFLNTFWKNKRKAKAEASSIRFWQPPAYNPLNRALSPAQERSPARPAPSLGAPEWTPPTIRKRRAVPVEEI